MIPYGRHQIDASDVDAVVQVLEQQFLTQGEQVPRFEQALCDYTGAHYAVAANSGTSALHLACLAMGIGPQDRVWTSPNSFVASANCARYCGARVEFVDIDPVTRNLSVSALERRLEEARASGTLPRALIVVHFGGLSGDMQAIRALTAPHGIALIEDACHALGGRYQGKPVGNCDWSDACVFSFHPVKSVTTAEGGVLMTNQQELAARARLFGSHGISRDPALMVGSPDGPWDYQQLELGYNYRLSDLHAALGVSQLARLDDFIAARTRQARYYHDALGSLPVKLPVETEGTSSAWHLYPVELIEHDRGAVFERLRQQGIGANVHYIPIHLQPYYRQQGFQRGDYPNAERFYQCTLTLPLFPSLTVDEQNRVVQALSESLS